MARDGPIGWQDALVQQTGGRASPQNLHVLDKAGQLGQLLRDLRLGDERALAPPDLDETAIDQVLNRPPHGRAADLDPLDQALFGRQLSFWRQAAVSDAGGHNGTDTFIER